MRAALGISVVVRPEDSQRVGAGTPECEEIPGARGSAGGRDAAGGAVSARATACLHDAFDTRRDGRHAALLLLRRVGEQAEPEQAEGVPHLGEGALPPRAPCDRAAVRRCV